MISDQEIVNGASAQRASVVLQAEMAFVAAQDHLRTLKERALLRHGYDPEAYDAAIMTYREARAWAVAVRTAWQCWQAEHGQADGVSPR
jgi:hypothetical protein